MTLFTVPLKAGTPQTFNITLGGIPYKLTLQYRNVPDAGWVLDIADANGIPILSGLPLVTGANLLAQHKHLGFTGGLYVQTTGNPDAVPTFANLGSDGLLYWVAP